MILQKLGGYAAIAAVCTLIAALASGVLIQRSFDELRDPAKILYAISTSPANFYAYNLLLLSCFALLLITVIALHERLHANVPFRGCAS